MARRGYSDQQRAEALAALDANGGNVSLTARQTNIPRVTLIEWRDGRVSEGVSEVRQVKREALADRLEALAHAILDTLPDKILSASAKDAGVVLGIATEKMQLLRNKPTEIQQQQVSEDERRLRIAELLGRGEDRASAAAPDAGRTSGSGPVADGVSAVH